MYLLKENSSSSENPLFINLKSLDYEHNENQKLFLTPDATIAKELFEKGFSNKGLIKWCMDNFMKSTHIFLDINAGFGEFSLHLGKDMKKTYAFEPNPKNYACLVSNLSLNNLSDKVIPLPFKLSNETKLNINRSGTCFVYKLDEVPFLSSDEDLNIGFIRSPGNKNILEGAKETLIKNHLPPILFTFEETNMAAMASKKELFEYLESLKYKIVVINGVKDTFLAVKVE
jgi:tRNA G37 N-methylase Trm5